MVGSIKIIKNTSQKELKKLEGYSMWNNINIEKKKFWFLKKSDQELKNGLEQKGLIEEFNFAIKFFSKKEIIVADLAAGTGWVSALLSKIKNVRQIYCLEMSNHRLKLFPKTFKALKGNFKKTKLYLGSFYKTRFKNSFFDIIFLSQAFHHAHRPIDLLNECNRILKIEGKIIMIGEDYINYFRVIKRFFSKIIYERVMTFDFKKLFPTNQAQGDHHYFYKDYEKLAQLSNLNLKSYKINNQKVIYILEKNNVLKFK
jgi:ubiquinone/menaquinone biosynthesis C-methylase UbiE